MLDHDVDNKKLNVLKHINMLVTKIDQFIDSQLMQIIQHHDFLALEARWRGLSYLVEEHFNLDIKTKLLCMSDAELKKDLETNHDYEQTYLYHLLYEKEYDMPGGKPYGLIIFDHQLSKKNNLDLFTLFNNMIGIASSCFTPFIININSDLLALDEAYDLIRHSGNLKRLHCRFFDVVNKLQKYEGSRYLFFSMQQYLWRSPHVNRYQTTHNFNFNELITNNKQLCWGSSLPIIAKIVLKNFKRSGWFSDLNQINIDMSKFYSLIDFAQQSPLSRLEHLVTDEVGQYLSELGFLSLSENQYDRSLTLVYMNGIYRNKSYAINYSDLSNTLPYILCVARFAQYLKIIGREKIGSLYKEDQLQTYLQTWLYQYCGTIENNDQAFIKYPLKKAVVQIKENPKQYSHYLCNIDLSPNFRIDNVQVNISLTSDLKIARVR